MSRYKLTIEYDGTKYAGWQRQDNVMAVQQAIEEALEGVFQTHIPLTVAGRTDAGVHATGQVAHCDIEDVKGLSDDKLAKAINAHLMNHAVSIIGCRQVSEDFHARFSATNKLYRYTILNRQAKPAFDANRVWHVRGTLDADKMHEAAQTLLGTHDFTSFRDSECQAKSPIRTLDRLDVTRTGERVFIEAEAQSFLHHMVRNLVGTLSMIGSGREPVSYAASALAAKDRSQAGPTAPAQGLQLARVDYL